MSLSDELSERELGYGHMHRRAYLSLKRCHPSLSRIARSRLQLCAPRTCKDRKQVAKSGDGRAARECTPPANGLARGRRGVNGPEKSAPHYASSGGTRAALRLPEPAVEQVSERIFAQS
jgi:hypothetical protein